MIEISGKHDLEALHHITTLESVTDQAIREAEEQRIVAAQVIEALGWKNAENKSLTTSLIFWRVWGGFWFAAAMYWMWRAVR